MRMVLLPSAGLQSLLSAYNTESLKMALRIYIKTAENMSIGQQVKFHIEWENLVNENGFKYRESYICKLMKSILHAYKVQPVL